jgi:hypothetical protein
MKWLFATVLLLALYRFDDQLASWFLISASEIQYMVTGSLIGLATGFAIRKLETL